MKRGLQTLYNYRREAAEKLFSCKCGLFLWNWKENSEGGTKSPVDEDKSPNQGPGSVHLRGVRSAVAWCLLCAFHFSLFEGKCLQRPGPPVLVCDEYGGAGQTARLLDSHIFTWSYTQGAAPHRVLALMLSRNENLYKGLGLGCR